MFIQPCLASHNLTLKSLLSLPATEQLLPSKEHGKITYLCWHRRDYFQQRGGEEQELR